MYGVEIRGACNEKEGARIATEEVGRGCKPEVGAEREFDFVHSFSFFCFWFSLAFLLYSFGEYLSAAKVEAHAAHIKYCTPVAPVV